MLNNRENFNIKECSFIKAEDFHIEQMKSLWSVCFPDDKESGFTEFYFNECYDKKRAYVAIYKNRVCAMAYAPLIKYRFFNKNFEIPYIQGVATDPAFRNLGIADNLLRFVLADLYNMGVPFGVLKPFNVKFYQKSGWQVFAYLAEVNIKDIPHMENSVNNKNHGKMKIKPITVENYKNFILDISAVFEYMQKKAHNNYPLRSLKDWDLLLRDHFNDGGLVAGIFVENKMLAYTLFSEKYFADTEAICVENSFSGEVFLRETAFTDGFALKFLLENFKSYAEAENKSQLKKIFSGYNIGRNNKNIFKKSVILHLPVNQKLTEKFCSVPFGMLRIINAETLLSALNLKFLPGEKASFVLKDSVIEKNSGLYNLSYENGFCRCEKTAWENSLKNSEIIYPQIDAFLLTSLLVRCYNFYEGEKNSAGRSYFNDYFK